ncbi:MAG: putative 4-mercaptohistidine N1-methyltransferase [Verrucomicrobia bacterium]|nr:putative 4-mercaptohistidine N1-methyltransferase [Verrucomicrobiota bacterium]
MSGSFYESDRAFAEYLLFHYGLPKQVLPFAFGPVDALDFPVRCVKDCLITDGLGSNARALELGCAVGRSSFELARFCREVIGLDFSHRFIATSRQLQTSGALDYRFADEGSLTIQATAQVPLNIDRSRVVFDEGDAMNLPNEIGQFDVVLLANLIDRLREPQRCLEQLANVVKSGGQLIITSPCTWLEDFTPRQNWLGGFERNGHPVKTLDTIQGILNSDFWLASRKDLPFLIREHARKFQWSVAEATVWMRK